MPNMTLQIVLAIAGSIALLIGLFGGGIKAKEIEVPKISVWPRIFSILVGVVLIWTAIRLPSPPTTESPAATSIPPKEPAPTQIPASPMPSTSTDTPTKRPTNTPTNIPSPTAKPVPEIIPFGSANDPNVLNNAFDWQAGNSSTNAYGLASSPNALILIANGHTGQWAEEDSQPVIFHTLEGNFETQVKVVFDPTWGHELAALGIRSTQDHNTWLRLGSVYAVFQEGSGPEQRIVLDIDDQGKGGKIKTYPYPANTVYLKIVRQGSMFDFLYSADGVNWTTLQRSYIAEMPNIVEIFLTVGSWGDGGTMAQFSDLKVLNK